MSSGSSASSSCILWTWPSSRRADVRSSTASARRPRDQLKPQVLYTDIVDEVTDQHAVILNRNREASMILPGECLLLVEIGARSVRRRRRQRGREGGAADNSLVDCQMIGASGRLFISGERETHRRGAQPYPQCAGCHSGKKLGSGFQRRSQSHADRNRRSRSDGQQHRQAADAGRP